MKFELITSKDPLWDKVKEYAENCTWRAGQALASEMSREAYTTWQRVISVTDGENVCGYCTVQEKDCIPNVSYSPYISYIFVDEKYRGNRLSQQMIEFATGYLKEVGYKIVYLVSDHENLYEKYGFEVIDRKQAPWGSMEKIYYKKL